jgi:uncharacterized protein
MSVASVTPTGFHTPVADKLPEVVERLAAKLRPERIILFGSYAYGSPTPDSDVDLLVILETDASSMERYLAVSRLLYPRPFPVDILVRTPHEIEQALQTGDFFIKQIISQGRVLYERTNSISASRATTPRDVLMNVLAKTC